MALNAPPGFLGKPLPDSITSLLAILERYGIRAVATGKGKTINLLYEGRSCGYINREVLSHHGVHGVLGYRFAWSERALGYTLPWDGKGTGICPPQLAENLVSEFCAR